MDAAAISKMLEELIESDWEHGRDEWQFPIDDAGSGPMSLWRVDLVNFARNLSAEVMQARSERMLVVCHHMGGQGRCCQGVTLNAYVNPSCPDQVTELRGAVKAFLDLGSYMPKIADSPQGVWQWALDRALDTIEREGADIPELRRLRAWQPFWADEVPIVFSMVNHDAGIAVRWDDDHRTVDAGVYEVRLDPHVNRCPVIAEYIFDDRFPDAKEAFADHLTGALRRGLEAPRADHDHAD